MYYFVGIKHYKIKCFGIFGWGETYKKYMEGRDTEAISVVNSQQNSCYKGAQERGPVSRECEWEGEYVFGLLRFCFVSIMKYFEHWGVNHNILPFFSFQKNVAPQITVEAPCVPSAPQKEGNFILFDFFNGALPVHAWMLKEFSRRQEQHVDAVHLHQHHLLTHQHKARVLRGFQLSRDGSRPRSYQHPSDEAHAELLGHGAKNH